MGLESLHVELADANAYVTKHHRHHKKVTGHRFSLGAVLDGELVGVAIVGRPVARSIDQRYVLEVNRCCTDGTGNAASFLYGRAAQVGKLLGYAWIITYTTPAEGGASLRAVGWGSQLMTDSSHGSWHGEDVRGQNLGVKIRWHKQLNDVKQCTWRF